jgi:hypothetical protein
VMNVPYLAITNGMQLLAAEIRSDEAVFIQELPEYPAL